MPRANQKTTEPSEETEVEPRIRITFSKWRFEGEEADPEEEHGWIDEDGVVIEPDEDDEDDTLVDAAVDFLTDEGAVTASSSSWHKGLWYSSDSEQDPHTGWTEQRSYHLVGFTEEESEGNLRGVQRRGVTPSYPGKRPRAYISRPGSSRNSFSSRSSSAAGTTQSCTQTG